MEQTGLVQVYTGRGKGKTTAAFGLALREWGHGGRVCIVQFMKKGEEYGEVLAVRRLEGIDLHQFGRKGFIAKGRQTEEDELLAKEALEFSREALSSGKYDLVVMDEACVALDFQLISLREVLSVVRSRSKGTEVVLTGVNAPVGLIEAADLVTEMRLVKHPYEAGLLARKGIEY